MVDMSYWKSVEGFFSVTDSKIYEDWAKKSPNNATFVEVGVYCGRSSSCLLSNLINLGRCNFELYCVDIWDNTEHLIKTVTALAPLIAELKKMNPNKYYHPVKIIAADSITAAKLFGPESVWGVFIDTVHTDQVVTAETERWFGKVQLGGRIGYHDYHDTWPGVMTSIDRNFVTHTPVVRSGAVIDFEKTSKWDNRLPIL
jgi:hypothetical protein